MIILTIKQHIRYRQFKASNWTISPTWLPENSPWVGVRGRLRSRASSSGFRDRASHSQTPPTFSSDSAFPLLGTR
ncbi:hypothetical protein DPMN_033625 [Dreissena polymorpha]|uniref:Uncharacterized protein n=1 Tax=Dreissena polymorpha TaxID=45954 RepID=A0A9D4M658_DREPO|nr:hypothetical protein DPMN_033625 [Dreissena polymorpha]